MSEKVKAYHTTNKNYTKSIQQNGFEMSKPNKGHWLGTGVYFYEDIYFAVEWCIIGVNKNIKNYVELCSNCDIIYAIINCEDFETLDISSPRGYSIFQKMYRIIENNYTEEEYKEIIQKGDAYIVNILEELELKIGIQILSNYDIIVANYPKSIYSRPNNEKSKPGNFTLCSQKQICVKTLEAISEFDKIKIDNNKEIENIYDLVVKNRSDIYG